MKVTKHEKFLLPDELKTVAEPVDLTEMTDDEAVEAIIELLDKFKEVQHE